MLRSLRRTFIERMNMVFKTHLVIQLWIKFTCEQFVHDGPNEGAVKLYAKCSLLGIDKSLHNSDKVLKLGLFNIRKIAHFLRKAKKLALSNNFM